MHLTHPALLPLLLLYLAPPTLQVDISLEWWSSGMSYFDNLVTAHFSSPPPGHCCRPSPTLLPSLHHHRASETRFTHLLSNQFGAGWAATGPLNADIINCVGIPLLRVFGPGQGDQNEVVSYNPPWGEDDVGGTVGTRDVVFAASWVDLRVRFPPGSEGGRYLALQGVRGAVWGRGTWSAASDGVPFPKMKKRRGGRTTQEFVDGRGERGTVYLTPPPPTRRQKLVTMKADVVYNRLVPQKYNINGWKSVRTALSSLSHISYRFSEQSEQTCSNQHRARKHTLTPQKTLDELHNEIIPLLLPISQIISNLLNKRINLLPSPSQIPTNHPNTQPPPQKPTFSISPILFPFSSSFGQGPTAHDTLFSTTPSKPCIFHVLGKPIRSSAINTSPRKSIVDNVPPAQKRSSITWDDSRRSGRKGRIIVSRAASTHPATGFYMVIAISMMNSNPRRNAIGMCLLA
ncbi:MAG: hypothetical protein Q9220_003352 [cf. Caloplaca sp. 1 TL-2023]